MILDTASLLLALSWPNMVAFLAMISACEGTPGAEGYQALFGFRPGNGKVFTSFADHPRIRVPFTDLQGKTWTTSAAGKYQIEEGTWDRVQRVLRLPDFSPPSQDRAAVFLIDGRHAVDAVQRGALQEAIDLCGAEWASLPSSRVAQPVRSLTYCMAQYMDAGGALA